MAIPSGCARTKALGKLEGSNTEQNAASIAALMLTTEACIADAPDDDDKGGMPGGGMGGMM